MLHIIDIADESLDEKIEIVNDILKDMNISDIPVILVMNKVDIENNTSRITQINQKYPEACFISARKKIRLDSLKQQVINKLDRSYISMDLKLNYASEYEVLSRLSKWGTVLSREYNEEEIIVKFRYHEKFQNEIKRILNKIDSGTAISED